MKKLFIQVSAVVTIFVGMAFLMSYTKPTADEGKEYIVVYSGAFGKGAEEKMGQVVTQKMAEGYKCQGGISLASNNYVQAMVK